MIVAARVVVIKSMAESNALYNGNQVRKISDWDKLKEKLEGKASCSSGFTKYLEADDEVLINIY